MGIKIEEEDDFYKVISNAVLDDQEKWIIYFVHNFLFYSMDDYEN
jgi:hypothetical protein